MYNGYAYTSGYMESLPNDGRLVPCVTGHIRYQCMLRVFVEPVSGYFIALFAEVPY